MTTTIIVAIVAVVVALLIAVPVTCKIAVNNKIQKDAETVGTAEDKARSIIDEALKTAETKKREALLEVKEESLRTDVYKRQSEPLKEMYEGIFTKTFTLFYGETLHYYFHIERNGEVRETVERTVTMKKIEGIPGSKYQLLNQLLSARRLGKKHEVEKGLKRYLRQEQYVKEMFAIEKEQEK